VAVVDTAAMIPVVVHHVQAVGMASVVVQVLVVHAGTRRNLYASVKARKPPCQLHRQ
jgi:hypothetical protein